MSNYFVGKEFNNYGTQPPCKDCEKRQIGCHATCRAYQEYKQQHEAEKAEIDQKERLKLPYYYVDGTMHKKGKKK